MFRLEKIDNPNSKLCHYLITSKKDNIKCKIFQNLGASIQELTFNETQIIDGISTDNSGLKSYETNYKSAILFPFPNRIDDGKYSYNNKQYQFPINEILLNNALHGNVYDKEFSLIDTNISTDEIKLKFSYSSKTTKGFPFDFTLNLIYTITKDYKLKLDFEVLNNDVKSFPLGLGWHPYFYNPKIDESAIFFNSEKKIVFNDKMIPFYDIDYTLAKPLKIKNMIIDDCYYLTKPTINYTTSNYNLKLSFSNNKPTSYLQVYTPPARKSIAIEPMICAPNSFNNKIGLLELKPKEKYYWTIKLEIIL